MPRKQWAAFERVTAADVNTNLADQSVMVFASTAARAAALPSPTVGMQSAVTASPDLGAPRYWDGAAWTLVQNGSPYPNVLTLGDQTKCQVVRLGSPATGISLAKNTWQQVTASLGVDAIIHGWHPQFTGSPANFVLELGTGSAGSEVVRHQQAYNNFQGGVYQPIPYGIGVPNGTRIALRWDHPSTPSPQVGWFVIWYTEMSSPPALRQVGSIAPVNASGTSWVELGASPPLAGGVWITGLRGRIDQNNPNVQLGFGAAGSEVPTTPSYLPYISEYDSWPLISPIFWSPSTRLAFKFDNVNAGSGAFWQEKIGITWRETLA